MKNLTLLLLIISTLLLSGCHVTDEKEDDDGGTAINLPPPTYQEFPRWSPDGKTILYYHSGLQLFDPDNDKSLHNPDSTGIWAMDSNGNNHRKILNAVYADWSPDGEWIVYVAGAQIFKAHFNGETIDTVSIEQLTFDGRNFFPSWSPDGEWIAYDRSLEDETGPGGVWRMNTDGKEKENLFGGAFPVWHPSGTSILAVIGTSATSVWKRFKIYKINNGPTEILDAVVDADNRYPRYSPDGTQIVFHSDAQIWVMNENGSKLTQLTFNELGRMPDWSPDGSQIIYIGPKGTIWVMASNGNNQRPLTTRPEGEIN